MTMLSAALFAQPINDLCTNATLLTVDGPCIPGSTINAGTEDPSIDPTNYPTDVWYSFTATTIQTVVYVHPDMMLDPDIYIYDNCNGTQIEYAAAGLLPGELDSISFATNIGTTYYISVVGWMDNPTGDFCIEVLNTTAPPTPYDPCTEYITVQVSDPCYADATNSDTLVKTYYFTATSTTTKCQLDIYSPYEYCGVYVIETGCGGAIIYDGATNPGTIVGNQYTIEFPTVIGMDYLFYPFSSDLAVTTPYPMDYCIDLIEVLAVNDLSADQLEIYPNPAKNEITLTTKNATGTVELIDMTGRQVMSKEIAAQSTSLNIENLTTGIYTVRYFDGSSIVSTKLIKE